LESDQFDDDGWRIFDEVGRPWVTDDPVVRQTLLNEIGQRRYDSEAKPWVPRTEKKEDMSVYEATSDFRADILYTEASSGPYRAFLEEQAPERFNGLGQLDTDSDGKERTPSPGQEIRDSGSLERVFYGRRDQSREEHAVRIDVLDSDEDDSLSTDEIDIDCDDNVFVERRG
jgi:hypothetical protein